MQGKNSPYSGVALFLFERIDRIDSIGDTMLVGDHVIVTCATLFNYLYKDWGMPERHRTLVEEAKEYFKCGSISVHIDGLFRQ